MNSNTFLNLIIDMVLMDKHKQGRPIGSRVRQNIVEIIYFYKRLYGYEVYKIYRELFPPVTMRLIYYHLKKGVETKEFLIYKIEKKSGSYSWGADAQNVIYELGPQARPMIEPRIKIHWDNDKNKK